MTLVPPTTKVILMNENRDVLGRDITNSRSNYDAAATVSKQEAHIDSRFTLLRREPASMSDMQANIDDFLKDLERNFRREQFLKQLEDLEKTCHSHIKDPRFKGKEEGIREALDEIFKQVRKQATKLFEPGVVRKSDFFRYIAGPIYLNVAEEVTKQLRIPFDSVINVYDKAIIEVENRPPGENMKRKLNRGLENLIAENPSSDANNPNMKSSVDKIMDIKLEEAYVIGTGYGRVCLPFSKEHIRSEILCHGLGANIMHNDTRTVLDIG